MKKNQYHWLFLLIVGLIGFSLFITDNFSIKAASEYVSINNNQSSTKIRKVQLAMSGPKGTSQMMISNEVDFPGATWEVFQTGKTWYLDYGAGTKTVYVKFKDPRGVISSIYKDTIYLNPPSEMNVDFTINKKDKETDSRYVSIDIIYSEGVEGYIISNENNFTGLEFSPIVSSLLWPLSNNSGEKTVYMQFKDANGKTKTVSQKITYNQSDVYINEGSLLKGQSSTVYYLGFDGRIHPFVNSMIYHSWYPDFSNIHYVSNVKLSQYQLGSPVCVRPGTWLLKFKSIASVYAVEPGCVLRPLLSEVEAFLLYGPNWSSRVLEVDAIYSSNYTIKSYDVTDKVKEIVDRDHDGVKASLEKEYGSSDFKVDSDSDGLSDYEEIIYWFTDPVSADTDRDGYKDGKEILSGYLPAGAGKLTKVPENTYKYPVGSIILKKNNNKLYYHHSNNNYPFAGNDSNDGLFTKNNLNAMFIINSPIEIIFPDDGRKRISDKEEEIYYPTQIFGEKINKL